ncbi:hypothetical protein AKL21_01085 [Enterococcus canintestini]|uniref:Uncharacterized protein n=1 Tax=Enterococcus canintestini TaxID=317010 RepID=A0A267HV51_9ENTE|nr:hypothetical protein AKL21_01085 [Enterococcus canintestini]
MHLAKVVRKKTDGKFLLIEVKVTFKRRFTIIKMRCDKTFVTPHTLLIIKKNRANYGYFSK